MPSIRLNVLTIFRPKVLYALWLRMHFNEHICTFTILKNVPNQLLRLGPVHTNCHSQLD